MNDDKASAEFVRSHDVEKLARNAACQRAFSAQRAVFEAGRNDPAR